MAAGVHAITNDFEVLEVALGPGVVEAVQGLIGLVQNGNEVLAATNEDVAVHGHDVVQVLPAGVRCVDREWFGRRDVGGVGLGDSGITTDHGVAADHVELAGQVHPVCC